jgi:hypothetical protein
MSRRFARPWRYGVRVVAVNGEEAVEVWNFAMADGAVCH